MDQPWALLLLLFVFSPGDVCLLSRVTPGFGFPPSPLGCAREVRRLVPVEYFSVSWKSVSWEHGGMYDISVLEHVAAKDI